MHKLAFKDPGNRVYIIDDEIRVLPPLAEGYEWTMVMGLPVGFGDDDERVDDPEPASERRPVDPPRPGFADVVYSLFTPREGQTPRQRAQELIDALPEDVRDQVGKLFRALVPQKPAELPPFPSHGAWTARGNEP